MAQLQPGDWLSAPGGYRDLVRAMCASDPRLRRRDPKIVKEKIPWFETRGKVVMLEADPQSLYFKQPRTFDAAASLTQHFDTRSPDDSVRRVYILEGQNPEFIAVIGEKFMIHPSFFMEHERVDVIAQGLDRESDAMMLPSVVAVSEYKTFKYYELLPLPDSLRNTFWISCAVSGRHIGVTRLLGSYLDVGIARRKCSIWSRRHASGTGWDCVIITDPPLETITRDKRFIHSVVPVPFRGGYPDFIPHDEQMRVKIGPSRTSLLDDLVFYFCNHSELVNIDNCTTATVFAEKIIVSHYSQLVEFLRSIVSATQWHLSRQERMDKFNVSQVEAQWSDVQALERRMSEYAEDIEAIMIQNHIPLEDFAINNAKTGWADTSADFKFVRTRLKDVWHRVEGLNSAITALAGITGNRQAVADQELSLQEAKSTKALTFLGLVFIPLAYTASLFSMADPYIPGGDRFWLYFAVSFPLIFFVIAGYHLKDLVFSMGGVWSRKSKGNSSL